VALRTALALVLAFASAVLISLSYLREHRAVGAMEPLSLGHPVRSLRRLIADRDWVAAFAIESTGFGLYVAALALADLALVQSVAAGGVGVLAVASARVAGRPLSGRERAGAALAVAGLLALAISLSGRHPAASHGSTAAILAWLAATVVVAGLVVGLGARRIGTAAANGIAGGLLFSAGDLSTKLATQGGARFLFAVPMVGGYLLGTSLLQIGYQSGAALTIAGIATLLTNALPIAAGSVLLAEPIPSGALGVLRVLAFAAVVAGAAVLARPRPREAPGH
jgi:hypothetical protein